jgi:hypothetical protein
MRVGDIVVLVKKVLVGILVFIVPLLIFYYGLKLVQYAL